ncbi:hypothetical protein BU23DRAFT_257088 [Bimuria novae-zelandiae CBS 107.79]|uniref:Uncharacterized protein n=1 Tax=Bimuria novae-zelandiae CBS 107.79 TaxID=1447943 RepID=A0A6A5V699_9PLEO|nr:hypothetical protein BU23DRAFT_257088 [Bimuria novae-zelandiae CBS 107.79]
MQRAWFWPEEKYNTDVKHDRIQKYYQLQFYGSFTYNHKGPYHIYNKEIKEQTIIAQKRLHEENAARRQQAEHAQHLARGALRGINANDRVLRSRKQQYTKKDDYQRGQR